MADTDNSRIQIFLVTGLSCTDDSGDDGDDGDDDKTDDKTEDTKDEDEKPPASPGSGFLIGVIFLSLVSMTIYVRRIRKRKPDN